ncbi:hypothetical protein VNO78_09430 [Psophocarpus tetragonolobus]|uniref:Non-haem dioxygenase N-terminal domain-containing protein n=1 Tax=Psophocarpus tetragonolobus TaxID=3891 RepID=A0AAN9SW11_PSOTE
MLLNEYCNRNAELWNRVPFVQELVKQPIAKVPEQYVRLNLEPTVEDDQTSLPQVPVIDRSKLFSEDATELEKLDQACKEWGFFQIPWETKK